MGRPTATCRLLALALLVQLVAGCAVPGGTTRPADLAEATRATDDIIRALGTDPDSRRVLRRTNNSVNTLADTTMSRWEDFPHRNDPLQVWADALQQAGFHLTHRADSYPPGRPNSGTADHPELIACLPGADPPVGALVSVGRVAHHVVVAVEVGGPPATAGC